MDIFTRLKNDIVSNKTNMEITLIIWKSTPITINNEKKLEYVS